MPCFNLGFNKLSPARRKLRCLASKFQSKIRKLHAPSPAITKPRPRSHKLLQPKSRKPVMEAVAALLPHFSFPPSLSLTPQKTRRLTTKPFHVPTLNRRRRRRRLSLGDHRTRQFQKMEQPVCVNELSEGPVAEPEAVEHRRQPLPAAAESKGPGAAGIREESAGDEIWETAAAAAASPQTRGIDERAEEFIARFRAEMERQERLCRCSHIQQ